MSDLRTTQRLTREMGRRDFLKAAAVLGISPSWIPDRLAERFSGMVPRRTQQDLFVVNMLGGIRNPNVRLTGAGSGPTGAGASEAVLDERAINDAIASGMAAVNTTVGYVAGPRNPFEHSVADIARWNQRLQDHPDTLLKVWCAADIERAHREGKVGIIMGFQNAAMMGDDAGRVEFFAVLGVRVIQLTYNGANQLGHGSMVPENGGLTSFGHEVIEALNASQTLVDLSHSGQQTCLDAIRASVRPVAITHTGCRALTDTPRNKTDEELRLVAEGGGIVGIYFMPFLAPDSFADAEDVVRHVEHAINVCGEDHVGIGTDGVTTQIDDFEAFREAMAEQVAQRQAAGISAKGERAGVVPLVPDLQGPDQFRKLADMLTVRGHSTARVEKILGLNAFRVIEEVWGT